MRNIVSITDKQGNTHTDTQHIKNIHQPSRREIWESTNTSTTGSTNGEITTRLSNAANTDLEAQVTMEEMKTALRKGEKRKAPGSDGIYNEFYTAHWDIIREEMLDIIQQMHTKGNIMPQQKHGIIVLLPKTTNPTTPDHYRALTLLNAGKNHGTYHSSSPK
jgi:hypothetical protein